MRRELDGMALAAPAWPLGVSVRSHRRQDARKLHSMLRDGYLDGGAEVEPFEAWLTTMTADREFDPTLWFLAEHGVDLVGAILCWTSAFVKDLVVAAPWRRRGLGGALLRCACREREQRGARGVELKVDASNLPALGSYEGFGMRVCERLSRPAPTPTRGNGARHGSS